MCANITREPSPIARFHEFRPGRGFAVLLMVPVCGARMRCERLRVTHLTRLVIAQLFIRAVETPLVLTRHGVQSNIEVVRTLVTLKPVFLIRTLSDVARFDVAVLFVVPMRALRMRCKRLFMAHLTRLVIAQLFVRAVWTPPVVTRHVVQSNIERMGAFVTLKPVFPPRTLSDVARYDTTVLLVVPMCALRVRCKATLTGFGVAPPHM